MSNIEKVLAIFQGISRRDPALATEYIDPTRYVEHDPQVGAGIKGVKQYVAQLASDDYLDVVRAYEDGVYVVTQADGHVRDDGTFFDVFRFEDGLIVEHWGFSASAAPANKSGHTQVDGPTEARRDVHGDTSKALVKDYYETVHLSGHHDQIGRFMSGDLQIRHEPGVADGVGEFARDLEMLTRDRTIDEISLLLGQGDFVFIAAKGTHQGDPCAYIDLYRVEDDQLVEHWGFFEPVPPPDRRKNDNTML